MKGSASLFFLWMKLLTYELESAIRQPRGKHAALVDSERRRIFLPHRGELAAREMVCVHSSQWIANQVIAPAYPSYIFLSFAVRWNLIAVLDDRAFTGIVSSQSEIDIAKKIEQESHITRSPLNVLTRVVNIRYAETRRRRRHQLHEAARAFRRYRARLEGRLLVHDGIEQEGIH